MAMMTTIVKKSRRCFARVVDSSASPLLEKKAMSPVSGVPEGHVPLHVGAKDEVVQRFVVRAELLSRPPFVELLRKSAQEYGYGQRGVLRIPCRVAVFENVLDSLVTCDPVDGDEGADRDLQIEVDYHRLC